MQTMNKDAEGGKALGWMGKVSAPWGEGYWDWQDGERRVMIALMGVERGRKVHGRVCAWLVVGWLMGASIWRGVLQSGALQKNRFQLKTGAGVFCSCCLAHII